jgi:CRISPR/Cas system-associated endonuclease Cas3-HD
VAYRGLFLAYSAYFDYSAYSYYANSLEQCGFALSLSRHHEVLGTSCNSIAASRL